MTIWQYCTLSFMTGRHGGDFYFAAYFSPELINDAQNALLREEFSTLGDALNSLGKGGWEAFHIDASGTWYFRRPEEQFAEPNEDYDLWDDPS